MKAQNNCLQIFAWFAFIFEIVINLIMIFLSMFYPIDPTLTVKNFNQDALVFLLLVVMIMLQIISFIAIKNLNSHNKK